jgi:hypothetical protein
MHMVMRLELDTESGGCSIRNVCNLHSFRVGAILILCAINVKFVCNLVSQVFCAPCLFEMLETR